MTDVVRAFVDLADELADRDVESTSSDRLWRAQHAEHLRVAEHDPLLTTVRGPVEDDLVQSDVVVAEVAPSLAVDARPDHVHVVVDGRVARLELVRSHVR